MSFADRVCQQRAELYRWFSTFFARELTQQQIDCLQQQKSGQYLSSLKSIESLNQAVSEFQRYLTLALARPDNQLELAADYATLFLMPPPQGVLLYAGYYSPNTPQGSRLAMQEYLRRAGYVSNNNEPPDHLAIQLELLATLVISENPAMQLAFIQQQLCSWFHLCEQRCQQQDNFGFYASLSSLLQAFIQQDISLLQEWIGLAESSQNSPEV